MYKSCLLGESTKVEFLRGTFSEERFLSNSPPNLFGLREPFCLDDMGEKGKKKGIFGGVRLKFVRPIDVES